ncbi:transcriptional coactivator/pterin dehydratase [Tuber magnatum]|uniref:4a-hydroxytetrahydrobiopterin dehydratase n=1 Tax=Tuber magnatum TaxID=42249 RepID=A0A317SHL5_9PEZI|nr:transcriptional coactivator/pterin dehydratase [Tuber magnatum]
MSTSTLGEAQALAEANEPQWSLGTDEATKKEASRLISGGKWSLSATRMGIEREFKFKTFAKTMVRIFINQIADQCKVKKHHPEWANVYNKVTIRWTTHNPEGLSYKDVEMAKFCDDKGTELGEIGEGKIERGGQIASTGSGHGANVLNNLLGKGVQECGPCSGPSKASKSP